MSIVNLPIKTIFGKNIASNQANYKLYYENRESCSDRNGKKSPTEICKHDGDNRSYDRRERGAR